jgi:predicted dehydrogenase
MDGKAHREVRSAGVKRYGFGILGTGMVAEYHRQAIAAADGAELIAVAHHDAAQFARIGERFGVPCLSEAALLARADIDVIVICTPSGQHAEQAIRAAAAGKHVLVEKPLALTLDDADAMIEACQASGVLLAVCLQRRTEPLFQSVRQAVEAGDLGELTLASLSLPYYRSDAYYGQAAWRGTWAGDGGGVLMNQGIHLIDLLVWYLGDAEVIQAQAATLQREVEVEDTLVATLGFPGGALAAVAATTTAGSGFAHRLELHGTRGSISIHGEGLGSWTLAEPGKARVPVPKITPGGAAGAGGDPRGINIDGHVSIIANLVATLAGR